MTMLLFYSSMMATLLILTLPTLKSLTVNTPSATKIMQATKMAFMLSLLPATIFINTGLKTTTTHITWMSMSFNISVDFLFDTYSTMFLPVALFITWAIMDFALWYMASDPNLNKFIKYLLLFLITMVILVTANNMLQLFIGWEGVGIMSFLLIGWWHARAAANTSALQAVIYNRVGDIGLILSLAWLAMELNSWEMQQLFSHTSAPILPLLGLILAAMGKSAQFGLHPWLPAAMEGPTPVSALLHSSTMVVAGIFLLIRFHPAIETNPFALSSCLCLGAVTTTFSALCALTQNDIKKIIAFSTSSQLGLMMLTLGLNQPDLAFLHIITHAFFKAMLFLCSGTIIHSLHDEQDIRKMGGVQKTLPITTSCMVLGNLALTGTPFLAGFYTKDAIIEAMNTSHLNAWALITTLMATALTAAYSLRLTFYVQLQTPRYPPLTPTIETGPSQTNPIIRLATGAIIMGLLITTLLTPNTPQTLTMMTLEKLAALITSGVGLVLALDVAQKTTYFIWPHNTKLHTSLTQLNFFNTIIHRTLPQKNMNLGSHTALQLNDLLWYEHIGPNMMKTMHMLLTNKLSQVHTGSIKTYLSIFTMSTLSCLALSTH
uniref:NADH-ubiquinone oxidoreductase chain 5 n=1 Tax=Teratoscincus roborowskii TaxID=102174 RepID=A0A0C4ZQ70_9SAUR|nr:NADH dehydrogenase subunit 5 [Teratoscincus roborowskii]AJJ48361.1 NADH dehydrogenase subunit 5 [Teratoscincus roborowskii]